MPGYIFLIFKKVPLNLTFNFNLGRISVCDICFIYSASSREWLCLNYMYYVVVLHQHFLIKIVIKIRILLSPWRMEDALNYANGLLQNKFLFKSVITPPNYVAYFLNTKYVLIAKEEPLSTFLLMPWCEFIHCLSSINYHIHQNCVGF